MSQPLLAFLIPSRRRVDGLLTTLQSLRSHPDAHAFELRVWFDDDDHDSLPRIPEVEALSAHVHTGPRLSGYNSTGHFCSTMARASNCPWITICDDDNVIEGGSFIPQLRSIDTTGVFCNPATYRLHNCHYHDHYQYGVVPNGSWTCESPDIGQPTDWWLHESLVLKRGWRVQRLANYTMGHNWAPRKNLH